MKNINFSSNSKNIINQIPSIYPKYELTSPNKSLKYLPIFKVNNNLSKTKIIFQPEKMKEKENIFKEFKNTPRKQFLKEQIILKKKKIKLLDSFSVLNDANIDEGIVLNKYFVYLKNADKEYNKYMELKKKKYL